MSYLFSPVGTPLNLDEIEMEVWPGNATNKTVTWSIKDAGTTGASITGSTLNTTSVGTVVVAATITDGIMEGTDCRLKFIIYID